MNRYIRMRRHNQGQWDSLFPQTVTDNILRRENGGVLENYLVNYDNHIQNNLRHINHATTTNVHHPNLSSHRYLDVNIEGAELADGFPLLLTTHTKIDAEPLISFNDGDYYPIVSASGEQVPGGQVAGTTILVVWNQGMESWILLSTSDTSEITKIAIPTFTEYNYVAVNDGEQLVVIPGFDKDSCSLELNYGQTILRMNYDYIYEIGRKDAIRLRTFSLMRGDLLHCKITKYEMVAKSSTTIYDIVVTDAQISATVDDQTAFALPPEVQAANVVVFNYNQTILRNGIDYELNGDNTQMTLRNFSLKKNDIIYANLTTLVERDASVIPRKWNVPGAYTYEIKTIHGSFVATEDGTNVIPIPEFKKERDELVVIIDNKVLVYDVDYEIDSMNQVILQDAFVRNVGDELHYTIFQGAINDSPPFMVLGDQGENGQHLILDLSYDLLRNGFTVLLKLKKKLVSMPTIKCIDGPAEFILDCFGTPITGGYVAGAYLMVIYDETNHVWYSMSHGHYDISESYKAFEFAEGDSNFLGNDTSYADLGDDHIGEMVIPHGLSTTPTDVEIHPTEHPGFIDNPYPTPTAGMNPGAAGDNVRWMQWGLWQLHYVQDGITLDDWVTGMYDDRTQDVVEKWQRANNLEVKPQFDNEAIDKLDSQTKHIRCEIGDIWSSADEANIYVGNSGNATSKFHWVANTSNGTIDYKSDLEKAIRELTEFIETYPGNYYTRYYNFQAPAINTYLINIPDYNPVSEKIYLVNYGQTVLREGVDYNLTPTGIELIYLRLDVGEMVQVALIRQGELTQ